jgi:phage virion morphogenesis protein
MKSELLENMKKRANDLRDPAKRIAEKMKTSVDLRFRRSKDPDGNIWAELKHRQGQPLRDTGRLQRSITRTYGKDFAKVGTNTIYAPTHQYGAKKGSYGSKNVNQPIPWGDIPPRKFFGINDKEMAEYKKIIMHYLKTGEVMK